VNSAREALGVISLWARQIFNALTWPMRKARASTNDLNTIFRLRQQFITSTLQVRLGRKGIVGKALLLIKL
jgi:hypothetical protein